MKYDNFLFAWESFLFRTFSLRCPPPLSFLMFHSTIVLTSPNALALLYENKSRDFSTVREFGMASELLHSDPPIFPLSIILHFSFPIFTRQIDKVLPLSGIIIILSFSNGYPVHCIPLATDCTIVVEHKSVYVCFQRRQWLILVTCAIYDLRTSFPGVVIESKPVVSILVVQNPWGDLFCPESWDNYVENPFSSFEIKFFHKKNYRLIFFGTI